MRAALRDLDPVFGHGLLAEDLKEYLAGAGLLLSQECEEWAEFIDLQAKVEAAYEKLQSDASYSLIGQKGQRSFPFPDNANRYCPFYEPACEIYGVYNGLVDAEHLYEEEHYRLTVGAGLRPDICYTAIQMYPGRGRGYLPPYYYLPVYSPGAHTWPEIIVDGLWGLSRALPPFARAAILAQACILAYPQLALAISKGLLLWNKGTTREEYGHYGDQGPLSAELKSWRLTYADGVSTYQNVIGGLS